MRAAERCGVRLPEFECQRLVDAILNACEDSIQIDLDPPCALGGTDEEIREKIKLIFCDLGQCHAEIRQEMDEAVARAMPGALAEVAKIIGEEMSQHSVVHAAQLRAAFAERADLVEHMWGGAINTLDFLRQIVYEWSYAAFESKSGPYANPNTAIALNRIVARANETVGEIVVLVKSGYADGALARWRSLHEISVIAIFLAKHSDRCAEMYLAHHKIEELRLLEIDKESGTASARTSSQMNYLRQLRSKKIAMVNKYGVAFANDYGWASVELGRAKTNFREIEKIIGLETLRRGYQRANSVVHGGALATLTRISLGGMGVDNLGLPPAYGCDVAINYATSSLSLLIAELCMVVDSIDLVAMGIVVQNYVAKIREQLGCTQGKLSTPSPREKILMRMADRRKVRSRSRRISKNN